jgi:hypothetical protein
MEMRCFCDAETWFLKRVKWVMLQTVNTDHVFRGQTRPERQIPCRGGVEYLHCSPLSHRRRRKGNSRIWESKIGRESHGTRTHNFLYLGARSSIDGWGTMLHAGRSRVLVSMKWIFFSIYLSLPAALWSWGALSLQQKWVPGIFLGGKGRQARKADNLTAICEPTVQTKCGSLDVSQPYGSSRPLTGIDLPFT